MNTIHTVAIGDEYTKTLWARDSIRAWERYCDRHNLNLYVQTKPVFPFRPNSEMPHFEKFSFINRDFESSVLIVDLDSLPAPEAPNIFDLHSDRNITCRVNPYWHLKHPSLSGCDFEALHASRWPRFKDVKTGKGRWPDPDLWFFVTGNIVLVPPDVQQIFRENRARIMEETPSWDLSIDEGVWAFWIARFNREYNVGVDAFDPWKWAVPSRSQHFCEGQLMTPDCHTTHFPRSKHRYLSRCYTECYLLNSREETLAGLVLWRIRALAASRPMQLRLFFHRVVSLFRGTMHRIARHFNPPPPPPPPLLIVHSELCEKGVSGL